MIGSPFVLSFDFLESACRESISTGAERRGRTGHRVLRQYFQFLFIELLITNNTLGLQCRKFRKFVSNRRGSWAFYLLSVISSASPLSFIPLILIQIAPIQKRLGVLRIGKKWKDQPRNTECANGQYEGDNSPTPHAFVHVPEESAEQARPGKPLPDILSGIIDRVVRLRN